MCTSFVFKGNDVIVGFNFDNEPTADIKIKSKDGFVYGVYRFKDRFSASFGVNRDGGFSNQLTVPPSEKGSYLRSTSVQRIDLLAEDYLNSKISFEQAVDIASKRPLVNVPGLSVHSQLSDRYGRVLILEPGRGYKVREEKYSVMTNFSFFEPMATKDASGSGYDRYITASRILQNATEVFGPMDGMKLLEQCRQTGSFVTLVSMVYSVRENKVYWCLRGDYEKLLYKQF